MRQRAYLALVVSIAVVALVATVAALSGRSDQRAVRGTTTTSSTTTAPSTTDAPASSTTVTTTPSTTAPPPATAPATTVRQGSTDRPVVALTFDAGSDVGYAGEILDTLRTNGVTASFGVTGEWATANPALVARMAAEGHQLLNHSWDHPSFTGASTDDPPLPRSERLDQLARAEAAIGAASGASTLPWFRPPFGDEDESVRIDVGSAGYAYVALWTVDSLGWKGLAADAVAERCLAAAGPGVIYLFHVGAASTDAGALQAVIDGLRARGLGFVSLRDLVAG